MLVGKKLKSVIKINRNQLKYLINYNKSVLRTFNKINYVHLI